MTDESNQKKPDISRSPKFINGFRIGQKGMTGRKNLDIGTDKKPPGYGGKEKKS